MGNDLILRRWRSDDCQRLYDWRMDISNRRWFGDQSEFSYADHQSWFSRQMGDSRRFGYMLEEAGHAVAQIRFDPAEMPGCYRIAVSAAPGMTGRGLGGIILRRACQQSEILHAARLLIAETMADNIPSQKIFARQGFCRAGENVRPEGSLFCWLQPVEANALPPVPVQIFAPSAELEGYGAILARTGLGQISDHSAMVKIFFGDAICEQLSDESVVFHVNNSGGESVLDLALRFSHPCPLPITFANSLVAVAQIVAAIKFSIGAAK